MSDALKLVPVDPTREMLDAAAKEIDRCAAGNYGGPPSAEDLWAVMLAAAPSYEPGADREQLVIEISARMAVQVAEELRRRRDDADADADADDVQEEDGDWRLMSNGGRYFAGRGLGVVDLPDVTSRADGERIVAEWNNGRGPDPRPLAR